MQITRNTVSKCDLCQKDVYWNEASDMEISIKLRAQVTPKDIILTQFTLCNPCFDKYVELLFQLRKQYREVLSDSDTQEIEEGSTT